MFYFQHFDNNYNRSEQVKIAVLNDNITKPEMEGLFENRSHLGGGIFKGKCVAG